MFKVKAIYEYSSAHDDDLKFAVGQIITVTEEEDDEWYIGEYTDDSGDHHEGLFPRNFVEKYEPVAPPRPTRTRTKRDTDLPAATHEPSQASPTAPAAPAVPASAPLSQSPEITSPVPAEEDHKAPDSPQATSPAATAAPPRLPSPSKPAEPPAPRPKSPVNDRPSPRAASKPASTSPTAGKKSGPAPPQESDKPIGSFRDRIAAFNKAAAPPITPFKPAGLGVGGASSNFVKKPFVAPPPSRNAYVPPPREAPAVKLYRRDEDPEIKEREAENQETAERAGLVPAASTSSTATAATVSTSGAGGDDEEPKPMMSLKERMARLQREQMEQANRHAEAAAKKEKPKRPPKKRMDSQDSGAPGAVADETGAPAPLERRDTDDTAGRRSIEEAASHPPRVAPRRKASKDPSAEAQDGNDADMSGAGDTTEGQDEDVAEIDDSDDKAKHQIQRRSEDRAARDSFATTTGKTADEHGEEEEKEAKGEEEDEEGEEGEEEEEEEEEEEDPEQRRREELRARMAKMSGGMGMMGLQGMQGMFGAAPPLPPKKKKAPPAPDRRSADAAEDAASSTAYRAPPIPTMLALPGMTARKPTEDKSPGAGDGQDDDDQGAPAPPSQASPKSPTRPSIPIRGAAPPPPVPSGRPAPRPSPADVKSPSEGSASDDELSEQTTSQEQVETPRAEISSLDQALPPPPSSAPPPPAAPTDDAVPASPTSPRRPNKRNSRLPPPIPWSAAPAPPPPPPAQTRPPPPPPPAGGISRQSTSDLRPAPPAHAAAPSDDEDDEEVTEYEGDYDTDIANPVPHKNSLKSHARDSSVDDNTSLKSPVSDRGHAVPGVSRAPPPPPPIPNQPPLPSADTRRSVDVPRMPPPPPPPQPPAKELSGARYVVSDEDYDPYNYSGLPSSPGGGVPMIPGYAPPAPKSSVLLDDTYTPPDLTLSFSGSRAPPGPPQPPPPPPPSAQTAGSSSAQPGPPPVTMHSSRGVRASVDASRPSLSGRRSVDVTRPSLESGFVANDVDLAPNSGWWLQPKGLPPQLQGRKDIFFESEDSQTSKRGGKVEVRRDIYILYMDYSQTVITVRFDPVDGSDAQLEQRHEGPPRSLRQDQLEQAYERFGRGIGEAVAGKKDQVVGDGSPQALVVELLRPLRDALLPVGTRAYGALVYSNLANASTNQNDEIRAGDIITLRNARFQGKHGAMHAKYSMEVGKPDHVAVVGEWDGTKKKVRAWEQGRESKKVKLESFKLDDLRSGEVKIWRVMPRSWVGWEGQN